MFPSANSLSVERGLLSDGKSFKNWLTDEAVNILKNKVVWQLFSILFFDELEYTTWQLPSTTRYLMQLS
jgi:hypothetical protein